MLGYEIKQYTRLGVFKRQINPRNVTSEISYSEQIDGGQSNMSLSIIGNWEDYQYSDIIEIREVTDDNKTVTGVYTGVINSISITEYENDDELEIELLGISTILNNIEYTFGGARKFERSGTPGAIIKEIIDSHQTTHGSLASGMKILSGYPIRYTGSSIDISGSSITMKFDHQNCLSAIIAVAENSGKHWYIGADGVLYFQSSLSTKILTFKREIIAISRKLRGDDINNRVHFTTFYTYLDSQGNPQEGSVENTYSDGVSIGNFGIHEQSVSNQAVRTVQGGAVKANAMIDANKAEKDETVITVKRPISITPNMLITTQNTKIPIVGKRIEKIEWKKTTVSVYLGSYLSFGREIKK